MKRSTPLRRNTGLTRNKRLRHTSEKRVMQKRETDPHRRAYVTHAPCCEHCRSRPATDCHEIAAGSSRHRSVYLANTWLALCRPCHRAVQGMTFHEQFAIKRDAVAWDINAALGRCEV